MTLKATPSLLRAVLVAVGLLAISSTAGAAPASHVAVAGAHEPAPEPRLGLIVRSTGERVPVVIRRATQADRTALHEEPGWPESLRRRFPVWHEGVQVLVARRGGKEQVVGAMIGWKNAHEKAFYVDSLMTRGPSGHRGSGGSLLARIGAQLSRRPAPEYRGAGSLLMRWAALEAQRSGLDLELDAVKPARAFFGGLGLEPRGPSREYSDATFMQMPAKRLADLIRGVEREYQLAPKAAAPMAPPR